MRFIHAFGAALIATPLLALPQSASAQTVQSGDTQVSASVQLAAVGPYRYRGGGGFRYRRPYFGGSVFFGPRFGFYDPFYDPFWAPYYYPRRVIVRERVVPPEYLGPPPGPAPQASWYRCDNPQGFYPYVRQCNGTWQAVPVAPDNAPPPGAGAVPGGQG